MLQESVYDICENQFKTIISDIQFSSQEPQEREKELTAHFPELILKPFAIYFSKKNLLCGQYGTELIDFVLFFVENYPLSFIKDPLNIYDNPACKLFGRIVLYANQLYSPHSNDFEFCYNFIDMVLISIIHVCTQKNNELYNALIEVINLTRKYMYNFDFSNTSFFPELDIAVPNLKNVMKYEYL